MTTWDTTDFGAAVLGKTVAMTGSGRVIYDLALEANNGTLTLVE